MENNLQYYTGDLTLLMKSFAERYVVHLNATRAAEEAGSVGKNTREIGYRLLHTPKVAAYIEYLRQQQLANMGISGDRVLKELARLAFVDPRKMYDEDGCLKPMHEMDDDTAAAISAVDTKEIFEKEGRETKYVGDQKKVRLNDKTKALELIARHLNLFEKDNKSGASNVVVVTADESAQIWKSLDSEF
jgi:phage terminase small subunit